MALSRLIFSQLLPLLLITSATADPRISIHYNERPPYLITVEDGVVIGLTANPARKAFQSAGIPHKWLKTPSKRQMWMLKKDTGKDCLVGWFKNKEREQFARFTKPIYQNKPMIGLALFSNTKFDSENKVVDTLSNHSLTLLIKSGYSYGSFIDKLIEKIKPKVEVVTVENINMLRLLNIERADFFFTTEEEAEGMIESAGFKRSDYQYIRFSDMPPGNKRYILCSMQVKQETIDKLNQWIK